MTISDVLKHYEHWARGQKIEQPTITLDHSAFETAVGQICDDSAFEFGTLPFTADMFLYSGVTVRRGNAESNRPDSVRIEGGVDPRVLVLTRSKPQTLWSKLWSKSRRCTACILAERCPF